MCATGAGSIFTHQGCRLVAAAPLRLHASEAHGSLFDGYDERLRVVLLDTWSHAVGSRTAVQLYTCRTRPSSERFSSMLEDYLLSWLAVLPELPVRSHAILRRESRDIIILSVVVCTIPYLV